MRARAIAGTVFALGLALAAPAPSSAQEYARCRLRDSDAQTLQTTDCMVCHDGKMAASWTGDPRNAPPTLHQTHPVDVDYYRSMTRRRLARLRTPDEAVKLGAFLPDGQVRCVTCHDGKSTYRFKLAIPARIQPVGEVADKIAATLRQERISSALKTRLAELRVAADAKPKKAKAAN